MSEVILASGGMDSFLLWKLLAPGATNLFVDIGHKYAAKERAALKRLTALVPGFTFTEVQGPNMGRLETPSGIIPLRNAELILAAAHHGDIIYLGVVRDEINSDKSPTFLSAMATVLNESWRPQYWTEGRVFDVRAPMRQVSKSAWIKYYLRDNNSVDQLLATVSCYDGYTAQSHCGACPSCFKRWVALKLNDITQDWDTSPETYGITSGILKKAQDGTYPPERAKEILAAYAK